MAMTSLRSLWNRYVLGEKPREESYKIPLTDLRDSIAAFARWKSPATASNIDIAEGWRALATAATAAFPPGTIEKYHNVSMFDQAVQELAWEIQYQKRGQSVYVAKHILDKIEGTCGCLDDAARQLTLKGDIDKSIKLHAARDGIHKHLITPHGHMQAAVSIEKILDDLTR